MRNKLISLIVIVVVFVAIGALILINYEYPDPVPIMLNGTFQSQHLPLLCYSITFVMNDELGGDFYFGEDLNAMEKGFYKKVSEKNNEAVYLVNNSVFDDYEITYDAKNKSFWVDINGEAYHFEQVSATPTVPFY